MMIFKTESGEQLVAVPKEVYVRLLERDELLMALEQAGVKEWVRYPYALELLAQYKRDVE